MSLLSKPKNQQGVVDDDDILLEEGGATVASCKLSEALNGSIAASKCLAKALMSNPSGI